jgi:biotin operon repressor
MRLENFEGKLAQMTCIKHIAIFSLVAASMAAQAQNSPQVPAYLDSVGKIVGKAGTMNADGSYRINLPRTDVSFKNANGMAIPADLGLATYIAFSGTEERSLAVGDVAMLESEIDAVIDRLRAGGFEVVALHNHMTAENPRLFFAHFQAFGRSEQLANTFRSAINVLGKVKPAPKSKARPGKPTLNIAALSQIMGVSPQTFPSGVVRFATPRRDLAVSIDEQRFLPGMGLGSWVAMSTCDCGMTMAMGDTCCLRSELQSAIDALRKAGIHITAIHNHILGGNLEVSFLHYEAEADALEVARAVKDCWSKLGKG